MCAQSTVKQMTYRQFRFAAGGVLGRYLLAAPGVLCGAWYNMGYHTSAGVYWNGNVSCSVYDLSDCSLHCCTTVKLH